jgi:HEAT repeat protein
MKLRLLSQRRKVRDEINRALMFERDRNVVGLIQMLDSDVRGMTEHSIVRGHAAVCLGRLGDPRAIPHLMELCRDPEVTVRVVVMEALGLLRAREAERVLVEGLGDSARDVRGSAARALGFLGAIDAIPALGRVLDSDPDRWVRLDAVEALVILGDETARERVPEALRAISWRARGRRWKRLRHAAESGQALTPYEFAWDRWKPGSGRQEK